MCTATDCKFLWQHFCDIYCPSPFWIDGIIAVVEEMTFFEPQCRSTYRTTFETQRLAGRKWPIFHTPRVFTDPVKVIPSEFRNAV